MRRKHPFFGVVCLIFWTLCVREVYMLKVGGADAKQWGCLVLLFFVASAYCLERECRCEAKP